jgi:hypothetical protein
MAKLSFKKGTQARQAASKTAESLKRRGTSDNPFALSRYITKRAGPAGRARLAKRGLRR